MNPKTLPLLLAVLTLGAVGCESDAAPEPIVERAAPDALGEAGVVDRAPLTDVAPVNAATTRLPPVAVQPPPAAHHPAQAAPARQRADTPSVAPPPVLQSHDHAGHQEHMPHGHAHHGGGLGAVVDRVAPLP